MNTEIYITSIEATTMLGGSPTTGGANIRALARDGKIPGAVKVGRDWLIPRAWVEEKKRQQTEEGIPICKRGRPVTTGAGLRRRDRGGPGGRPASTGKPPGRPKKTEK